MSKLEKQIDQITKAINQLEAIRKELIAQMLQELKNANKSQ